MILLCSNVLFLETCYVLKVQIFCIKSIIMWTFEAQTLYGLKYINERSKNCYNTERHVYEIIAKFLVDKFLFVITNK